MIYRFSQPYDSDVEGSTPVVYAGSRTDVERTYSLVQQHDMESADITTSKNLATEVVNATGAEVDVFLRTDNADYDDVWEEDPNPTYWAAELCKVFFEPKSLEVALKIWGLDTTVALKLFFSYDDVLTKFGTRLLRMGDVIGIPFNAIGNVAPKLFRVVNATPVGNYKYSWMYLQCSVESLTGDITVQPIVPLGRGDMGTQQLADYHNE